MPPRQHQKHHHANVTLAIDPHSMLDDNGGIFTLDRRIHYIPDNGRELTNCRSLSKNRLKHHQYANMRRQHHRRTIPTVLLTIFFCISCVSSFSFSKTSSVTNPLALSTVKHSSAFSFPDVDGTLACLFGSDNARDAFFSNHFKDTAVHIVRKEANLESPLQEISMRNFYEACEFINLRKRGSSDLLDKSKMSFQDLEEYIQTGGSAVFSVVEKETGKMYEIKHRLEQCFGQELSFNVYHSGPNGVALTPHYDAYDVFVLQLEGEKTWEIVKSEEETVSLTLVPGDLLYIPQGMWHSAQTSDGFAVSTHVTIGLDPKLKKL